MTVAQLVRRLPPALVLTAVLALAATFFAAPTTAAKNVRCAEEVVADWYDNGRIDYVYPLRCYREAIKSLPPDVKDYSTAKEEIERALADATNRPRVTKRTPLTSVPCKKGERCIDPPSAGGTGGPGEPGGSGGPNDPSAAAEGPDTSGPSSVPIPLIVLGGLALLLLAAGCAGYLARRFGQSGEEGEPPTPA